MPYSVNKWSEVSLFGFVFFYFFVFDKVPIFGLNFETGKKTQNNRTPHPPKKKTKQKKKKTEP